MKKKILILAGGYSKEREISLETGRSCILALKKIGFNVIKFDPKILWIFWVSKSTLCWFDLITDLTTDKLTLYLFAAETKPLVSFGKQDPP